MMRLSERIKLMQKRESLRKAEEALVLSRKSLQENRQMLDVVEWVEKTEGRAVTGVGWWVDGWEASKSS